MALMLRLCRHEEGYYIPAGVDRVLAERPDQVGPTFYFGTRAAPERDLFPEWTADVPVEHRLELPAMNGIGRRAGMISWTGTDLSIQSGPTKPPSNPRAPVPGLRVRPWGAAGLTAVSSLKPTLYAEPRLVVHLGPDSDYVLVVGPDDATVWLQEWDYEGSLVDSVPPEVVLRDAVRPVLLCACRQAGSPGACDDSRHEMLERNLAVTVARHLEQLRWPARAMNQPLPKNPAVARMVHERFPDAVKNSNVNYWLRGFVSAAEGMRPGGFAENDATLIEELVRYRIISYAEIADLVDWLTRE